MDGAAGLGMPVGEGEAVAADCAAGARGAGGRELSSRVSSWFQPVAW